MEEQVLQRFRLSPRQRYLWERTVPDEPYRAQCAVLIEGRPGAERLRSAVERAVARHQALRTGFVRRPGIKLPFQGIAAEGAIDWRVLEPTVEPGEDWRVAVERIAAEELRAPVAFDRPPLLRTVLVRLGADRQVLVLTLPALCADRTSLENLVAEVAASCAGELLPVEDEEVVDYLDFSEWQLELLASEEAGEGVRFWDETARRIAELPLPGERNPAAGRGRFDPVRVPVDLDEETRAGLERAGSDRARSFLLAGLELLVGRLTGATDVTVQVVTGCRPFDELRRSIGPFAGALPVVVRPDPSIRFEELEARTREALERAEAHQEVPSGERAEEGGGPPELPGILFEHRRRAAPQAAGAVRMTVLDERAWCEPFRVHLETVESAEGLTAELWYDRSRLEPWAAEALAEQLAAVWRHAWSAPGTPVGSVDLLGERVRRTLVEAGRGEPDSVDTTGPLETIPERFAAQARKTPNRLAVVCGDRKLTFEELDRRAAGLARHLRSRGVAEEVRVGLLLERSVDSLVGILGAWKAGGVYVPLDPDLPAERLSTMLRDAEVRALVHAGGHPAVAGFDGVTLDLAPGAATWSEEPDVALPSATLPESLAYVLFTSGSTGRPKGVAVEHGHLAAYVDAAIGALGLQAGWTYAVVSTFSADLGHTVLFPPLVLGGRLVISPGDLASSPDALGESFARWKVDCLKIVPSHLGALLSSSSPRRLVPERLLVLGGEAADPGLVERVRELRPECRLVNHYGPTEATVGATFHPIPRPAAGGPAGGAAIPIGRPLPSRTVFVTDPRLQPLPGGVPGELCIGGAGIARGYTGRPRETAQRFVPDPFGGRSGARLYRTGDLVRWDGEPKLEFLGRTDHQVKLRGHRIELGEVESALRRLAGVWDAAVVLRDGRLVAFVVARTGERLDPQAIERSLADVLPEPMVPSITSPIDRLPLTANGKVDRRLLERMDVEDRSRAAEYVAPRNDVEAVLARIWSEVLRVDAVGIHDNFFELGGDSILSIQIVSRAGQAGLQLQPRELFDRQTIAELAAGAAAGEATRVDQGPVEGDVPLTPIQRRFFEAELDAPHHFNQSVLLELRDRLDAGRVRTAVGRLLTHHDALRLRFVPSGDGWKQSCAPPGGEVPATTVDLSCLDPATREAAVAAASARVQRSLDLGRGPLLRAVHFACGEGAPERLLLVLHHLVVDGVSWRILLEDLERLLAAGGDPARIPLPPKTVSFQQWAEAVEEAARSGSVAEQIEHWRRAVSMPGAVEGDLDGGLNTVASSATVRTVLERDDTETLLRRASSALGMGAGEVLVAALADAVGRWLGIERVGLELEGHGRERSLAPLDVSRTVGWFTIRYPVTIELTGEPDAPSLLAGVSEQLGRVPGHGEGYGLARYLRQDRELVDAAPAADRRISFNYLGQFDQLFPESSLFRPAELSAGATRDPRQRRWHLIEVTGMVVGERLVLTLTYSVNRHARESVRELADLLGAALHRLVEHIRVSARDGEDEGQRIAPELEPEELDQVLDNIEFEV